MKFTHNGAIAIGAAGMVAALVVSGCGGSTTTSSFPTTAQRSACSGLVGSSFGPATVTAASIVAASGVAPEYCSVIANANGNPNGFQMEAYLPTTWTGDLIHGGGGGLDGSLPNGNALWNSRQPLQDGSVFIGSNGGRSDPTGTGAGLTDNQALTDYSYAAIGDTYAFGRAVVKSYYKMDPSYKYFVGCSRGGVEAAVAAETYPDNYDGVISQAPALPFLGFLIRAESQVASTAMSNDDWTKINNAYISQCDSLDGVTDGIVSNPSACKFDPTTISSWSPDQLKAIKTLYSDMVLADGTTVAYKLGFGPQQLGYNGLNMYQAMASVGAAIAKYVVYKGTSYDPAAFNVDTDWQRLVTAAAPYHLEVDPAAVASFLKKGKKVLFYQGTDDAALSVDATANWYQQIASLAGASGANTQMRLFPGVGHCGYTGPTMKGPVQADMIGQLRNWVEKGVPPSELTASNVDSSGNVTLSRPICQLGKYPKYIGSGDPNQAQNFSCVPVGT
ncbi:feruloyl esterase [Paraburkholderia sp. BL6669N2]|uniref:tannase/feruloyl esterase family alpha/beta hydrolase n=1 Tax=Paraburkholderia sp. BL6669N2 TaxID=1938807 RepID=UPI000E3A880E|nr:tannase/feruloyl esterase family alpha/beta hydrolase [Paraburkholderia sp. BL6669N2]REG58789.1 feruloyl esterase [Paraburkholderia sp. BL6669N2]